MPPKNRKVAGKRQGRERAKDAATVTISGDALRVALAFGANDPARGVDSILRTVAAVWIGIQEERHLKDEAPDETDDGLTVSGFGVTARIDVDAATHFMATVVGAVIGDSIRASVHTEPNPSEQIEDLSTLASACVIDRVPEFWVILAAKFTHALYDTYGDALAAILSDVSHRWPGNSPLSIEQRKHLVQQIKDEVRSIKDSDETLPKKPPSFSGMRGGLSEATLLDEPTPEQLSAYASTIERVKPVWTQIVAMRNSDPEGWRSDADELAKRKFDAAAMKSYREVIARIPSRAQSLNSARIQPAVCAREHARTILGISARSDSRLKKLAAEADRRTA